jgi:hypothetical protein
VSGKKDCHVTLLKIAALELCEKYHISLRAAYRHVRNQSTPGALRKLGRDGKIYHFSAKLSKGETEKDLKIIRRAFNRLVSRGAIINEAERKLLVEIFGIVGTLLAQREAA